MYLDGISKIAHQERHPYPGGTMSERLLVWAPSITRGIRDLSRYPGPADLVRLHWI